ncbi:hypothetical protein [Vibrio vulnificus]|uniref:hypothetical protein n=1 Tax=Vibrio vulnificus TaxID=672 RepID=UPI001F511A4A|nr:hypothetical protein [Vibrio vulnificus]
MEENELSLEEERYLRAKLERQRRYRTAAAVVPAIIGATTMIYLSLTPVDMDYYLLPFSRTMLTLIVPISFMFSGISILMIYLQTGFQKNSSVSSLESMKYETELKRLRYELEKNASIDPTLVSDLLTKVAGLEEQVAKHEPINEAITQNQKEELVGLIKDSVLKESSKEIYSSVLDKIEKNVKSVNQLKEVESVFSRTLERLYSEINALSRRGNLNLSLGIFTTIIGLLILGYFVLEVDTIPEDKMAFIAHFIPRLSLVLLIEVFAYFFLKLYKSSLSEIKYFQNEMTNVEAKLSAIKCSIMIADNESTSKVIQALSQTERNSVLEKGQTTTEIEKARIEQQNIATLSEKVSNILSSKKSA